MRVQIEGLRNKLIKWKEDFESKGLKDKICKTKVMVSGSITMNGLSKSKVDPCGVCRLRVKTEFCVYTVEIESIVVVLE